jgi:hypothetical protein
MEKEINYLLWAYTLTTKAGAVEQPVLKPLNILIN